MSYSSVVLADTPVSYWLLADTTTTATDSSDANNGTYNGTYTQSQTGFGLSGNGVLFDGTTGYISVPDATNLHVTSVSLEALIKTTSSTSDAKVIAKFTTSGSFAGFALRVGSGILLAWGGSGTWISSNVLVNDGNWHHVVVTISSSGVITFYIDGIFILTTTIAQSFSNTASLNIARSPDGTGYFPGTISNAAIYNYVLTASQVAAHYGAIGTSGNIRETQQSLRAIISPTDNKIRSTQQPLRILVSPTNNVRSTQLALRIIHQNITGSLILVPMNGLNINSRMTGGMS